MTLEEFTTIIDIHGTDSTHWPVDVLEECESFIQSNAEARTLLKQQHVIDDLLQEIPMPDFLGLESRVLNQALPAKNKTFFDKFIEWLLPANNIGQSLFRPALTACLPIFFGIVLGNYFSFGVDVETDGFQYWDDELVMLSFTDIDESDF